MPKKPKHSAGLLMYRRSSAIVEVFLVHPGGPYFASKNEGSWTIPKGEYETGETPLAAAIREFHEETGFTASEPYIELGSVRQKSGKIVNAWAFEGDCDPIELVSNNCEVEWPPRSKRKLIIPEVDRGDWFSINQATRVIRSEQASLLEVLRQRLSD